VDLDISATNSPAAPDHHFAWEGIAPRPVDSVFGSRLLGFCLT
jgi:hypothetical protein